MTSYNNIDYPPENLSLNSPFFEITLQNSALENFKIRTENKDTPLHCYIFYSPGLEVFSGNFFESVEAARYYAIMFELNLIGAIANTGDYPDEVRPSW